MMNKISRFAAVLAVLFLVFGLTGCFFFPADNPSDPTDISDTTSFTAAMNGGADEVKLTQNFTGDVAVLAGKTKTLNLNGHTITGTLVVQGNLTIIDKTDSAGGITCTEADGCAVAVDENGTVTISDGNFTADCPLAVLEGGTAVVSGGVFEGDIGIAIDEGGTLTSLNAEVNATMMAIYNKGSIGTISGGSYIAETDNDYIGTVIALSNTGTITTISAGNFSATHNGPSGTASWAIGLNNAQGEITTIGGGSFTATYPLNPTHAVNSQGTITNLSDNAHFTPTLSD